VSATLRDSMIPAGVATIVIAATHPVAQSEKKEAVDKALVTVHTERITTIAANTTRCATQSEKGEAIGVNLTTTRTETDLPVHRKENKSETTNIPDEAAPLSRRLTGNDQITKVANVPREHTQGALSVGIKVTEQTPAKTDSSQKTSRLLS
jgi:hypothetical protein